MQTLWQQIQTVLWNVFHRPTLTDIVDILIVAFILYKLLMLTRETRASAVLKGLVMLIVAAWVSDLLGLTALNWVLLNVVNNGAVVLVILFQPELRKALEQIGKGALRTASPGADLEENEAVVREITNCLLTLSRRRVGALIVIEQQIGLKDITETGTSLNSQISAALLENIFEPNTPLHDGAVVIRGTRILAAACILSLSEGKGISRELGTRHRAALGITETTDAISLIVSEETGIISMARNGRLTRHLDRAGVEEVLTGLYCQKEAGLWATLMEKTKWRKGGAA
ncbi:MAG: diadenylate cyclase CdaA [Candidatus Limiplasma sp.]|nr:diadenylate cyclase CdaA [Clostridiales bacterium]MDY3815783.1 diadenylate cyclase CdaA [Candidatus Limiplasma sp.]